MRALIALGDDEEGESRAGNDRWMVSYADFITLLFVLFLALYAKLPKLTEASTAPPTAQAQAAADARPATPPTAPPAGPPRVESELPMPVPAQAEPVAQPSEPAPPRPAPPMVAAAPPGPPVYGTEEPRVVSTGTPESIAKPSVTSPPLAPTPAAGPTPQQQLASSLANLRNSGSISVAPRGNGWVIDIADSALFTNGTASPAAGAQATLGRIAEAVSRSNGKIIIEGHTDNQPVKSDQFASNWELSSARAAAVARALQESGVNAERLTASGLAHTRPRGSNDIEQGRRENRRISVVVMNPQ